MAGRKKTSKQSKRVATQKAARAAKAKPKTKSAKKPKYTRTNPKRSESTQYYTHKLVDRTTTSYREGDTTHVSQKYTSHKRWN